MAQKLGQCSSLFFRDWRPPACRCRPAVRRRNPARHPIPPLRRRAVNFYLTILKTKGGFHNPPFFFSLKNFWILTILTAREELSYSENMRVCVEENLNCGASEEFFFSELEPPKPIRGILVTDRGRELECDVVGAEAEGLFIPAQAVKVADSGAGFAYLIFGGAWGIRIRPRSHAHEPWDLKNPRQSGEPFKLYSKEDILF